MIDLSGKYVSTESNVESDKLLKMAISQGYKTPIGQRAMENCRIFHFYGMPYKVITVPGVAAVNYDKVIRYGDLCGDEKEELEKIVDLSMKWCRAHGYAHVAIFANDEVEEYVGKGMANAESGMRCIVNRSLSKPVKVSIEDIEKRFGHPIEIVT